MDRALLAWGLRRKAVRLPRLWLFTDDKRLPDPRQAVAGLPRGRAGVVFRHDADPARWQLGRDLAQICRARRLVLVVAGDARLAHALRAGMHLRGGRWPGPLRLAAPASAKARSRRLITSSSHSVPELRRAAGAGADLAFLSPAFATASHVGAPGLGPLRWGTMTRRLCGSRKPMRLAALGGVDGHNIRRLPPRWCQAVGAIAALLP